MHSKFNLPIRSNDQDDSANKNQNIQNKNPQSAEIESLKNMDQKLIDIIMSEVLKIIFFYIDLFLLTIHLCKYSSFGNLVCY